MRSLFILFLVFPLCYLSAANPDPHRFHNHGAQPRVFINQGLDYYPYGGYYGVPTNTEVRGNTIIQSYQLPPQRRLEHPVKPQNRVPPTNKDFLRNR